VNFRWGAGGINLNVHSTFLLANDADISLTGAEDLLVFTAGGDDIVSAAGGAGTGDPFPRSLWFDDPFGGDDIQIGGAGDDLIFNGLDADTIAGGKGRDTVRYQGSGPISVTIGSGIGDDGGLSDENGAGDRDTVGASIENVTGADGDDLLIGTGKGNVMIGGKGVDALFGGGGADRLRAKDGTADAAINCGAGSGDSATVDKKDPKPISC
jgi:Ca2+-binding RTX toxin-like protein